MALPNLPGAYRVRSYFSNVEGGRPWSTGMDLWSGPGGPPSDSVANAVVGGWRDLFDGIVTGTSALASYIRDEVRLQRVEVYDLGSLEAPGVAIPATPLPGGQNTASASLPPDLAVVVSKRTNQRGARGRGRSYLAGWASNALSTSAPGLINTLISDYLESAWPTTMGDLVAAGIPLEERVIGRIGVGSPIVAAYPIINYVVDNSWDVQRRRGLA